ncbi:Zinc finger C2H2 type [Trichostrongylus colubriformis]|uniref:Zinc finger C2H2 type n=1 Tax=Trichostrongylus colubriformis TaxID=6319 RepID=A0AAN8FNQ0_TRICO
MVSFVLVEAESQDVLMNLIQYLTGNSLKFTVATDIRRLFSRTYLDVDGACTGVVSSSSGDANLQHRGDINISSGIPSQFDGTMPNLFGMMAKTEPESPFGRWLTSAQNAASQEPMSSEVLCDTSAYLGTYPSVSTNSLESRAHQMFAADTNQLRGHKRSWHGHHTNNSHVQQNHASITPKCEEPEKKEKLREVACQLCGKRITMRRSNLRHHAAVVHSGIERYVCRCGYSTVHRNTIIRHMLKHANVESEKNYEFTDMLTPAEAEQIEKLTEECFRDYRTVPRNNEEADELVRSIENIVSGVESHNRELNGHGQDLELTAHSQELDTHSQELDDVASS